MPNETEDYNNAVRAALPSGMTYSGNRYRYNNHSFYTFELAAWYYYYLLRVNSPSNLFSANEVGVWYDPSDLTTLFQDSAGTTPVTAAGQPVGLMLDKSKGGINSNGSFARNLQVQTEDFSSSSWTKTACTVSIPSTPAPARGGTYGRITSTGTFSGLKSPFVFNPLTQYTVSGVVKKVSGSNFSLVGDSFTPLPKVELNFDTGAISVANCTGTATLVGANEYFVTMTFTTPAVTTTGRIIWWVGVYSGANTAGQEFDLSAPQIEIGSVTTDYQRITTSWAATIAGNHATQATSAQRPTYGIHPYSGARNRLLYSEQLNNAIWAKTDVTVVSNTAIAPDGSMTADAVVPTVVLSSGKNVNQISAGLTVGQTYVFSVYAKASGYNWIRLQWLSLGAFFNVSSGAVGNVFGGAAASITSVGNGWYRCSIAAVVTDTTVYPVNYVQSSNSQFVSWLGDGTSGVLFWGDQFELGSTATAYQKVVTQYEVTEAGVPSVYYIGFDGVDDGMVTSAINFSGTDAMTVFAGVRKLSDAARAFVFHQENAGIQRIAIEAPSSAFANYQAASGGTSVVAVATSASAPNTSVLSTSAKISTDTLVLRRNGIGVATSSADQGTGNYSNNILYIGRFSGSAFPFNGNIYSLIVRGAESTADQITNTETWVNQKTGAY